MGIAQSHGAAGESLAAAYLALIGWDILARNAQLGGVEVDLVALDGRTRVLVEVKYRARTDYGGAALAVDRAKRDRLRRAAYALISNGGGPVRIDVVAVELEGEGLTLRHFRNAVTQE
jgi:putative endonuclease